MNAENQMHHRMTTQRRAVMDVLHAKMDHPTADDIYHRVRRKLSRVSLATVYRNLDVLVEQKLVKVLESAGQPRRYDVDTSQHYHIRCVECGILEDVVLNDLPDLAKMVSDSGSFEVVATKLEFEGRCSACRKIHN